MRYALFQDPVDHAFELVYDEARGKRSDMLRISDYVEITFPPRNDTPEQIADQVKALDEEIARTEARNQRKIDALKSAKTAVLSLAFKTEEAA